MKRTGIALICWLLCLFGLFGIQRFYLHKWVTGIIWLLTGGVFLIGQIYDLFTLSAQVHEFNRELQYETSRTYGGYGRRTV